MYNKLEEKINRLKSIYTLDEDQRILDATEKSLRKMIVQAKLAERDDIKMLVNDTVKRISEIESILCNDEKLTEIERASLFKEKKTIKYYIIDRLGCQKLLKDIEMAEKAIDMRLEDN